MAKEKPTSRLLPVRLDIVGGFGDNLKWLRDLTEDKPESRTLTPMPLLCERNSEQFVREVTRIDGTGHFWRMDWVFHNEALTLLLRETPLR